MNELRVNRPTWNDEMLKELSEIVGKEVFDWCNAETDLEDCIETCRKVLKYHSNDNGYELAKQFEDEGFSPDSQLVELLDSVSYSKHTIQENFLKKWVEENNLKLDLEVGQMVVAKMNGMGGINLECEIMKLYPETMRYGLWNDKIGHVKGRCHRIVDAENIVNVV